MRIVLLFLSNLVFINCFSQQLNLCNCKKDTFQFFNYRADLRIGRNGINSDTLIKYSENNKWQSIKSIYFYGLDSISNKLGVFRNVEKVIIGGNFSPFNSDLNLFPKLKTIILDESQFNLNENDIWLQSIEVIIANKSEIFGLSSFAKLPNLAVMKLSFSGFDKFPNDFEKAQCLNIFQTGAHTFGTIDLNKLDFSKMPCLQYVEFHSWRNNITGLPKGLSKKKKIKIHYDKMKEKDKLLLKKTCS